MANTRRRRVGRADRLSNLPDSVLYHILSFLETKEAVQTVVLSRRWISAWKNVPALDLSSESFRNYDNFKILLKKILSLRHPLSLRKISLTDDGIPEDRDGYLLVRVIEYGLSHGARHLLFNMSNDISWEDGLEYSFSELFNAACCSASSLKTMRLDTFFIDAGFRSAGFRMLTKLELFNCKFLSDDPFSEFPCLEDLYLFMPLPEDGVDKTYRISGLRLHSLNIEETYLTKLEIDAPKLKDFHLMGEFVECKVLNLTSLDYAEIWVGNGDSTDDERTEYAKHDLMSLLHGLSNATTLRLGSLTLKVLLQFIFLSNLNTPSTSRLVFALCFDEL
ncbi:Putative FBD-associated F-box protein At5g22720 [Linum grandiflorum]